MEVSRNFLTGTKASIGGVGSQLVTTNFRCERGVQVFAPTTNSGVVYISNSPHMTIGSGLSSDGYPLPSGDSILLPIRNPELVYVKSNVGGLQVNWMMF